MCVPWEPTFRCAAEAQVVDRRCRRGEVVDEVDRLVDEVGLGDVDVEMDELGGADVLDVLERPGVEVVHAEHPVTLREQRIAEVGAQKTRPAGHKTRGHDFEDNGCILASTNSWSTRSIVLAFPAMGLAASCAAKPAGAACHSAD